MRIGIDIDGTITTPFYWLDYFNRHLGTNLTPSDIKHYDHHLDLGISLETFNQFRRDHLVSIHKRAVPREYSRQFVNALLFEDHSTFLITARENELRVLTTGWLKENGFCYSRLYHLGSTEKAKLALELGIELFVEDRLETAQALVAVGIPTLLFDTSYNQGPDHPLIMRIDTWYEVYQVIQRLEGRQSQWQQGLDLEQNAI